MTILIGELNRYQGEDRPKDLKSLEENKFSRQYFELLGGFATSFGNVLKTLKKLSLF